MKSPKLSTLYRSGLVLALIAAAGCSSIRTVEPGKLRTVELAQLTSEGGIDRLVTEGQPTVVVLRAGQVVPVDLALEVPFAKLAPGDNKLTFTRDTYVYIGKDGMLLSFDNLHFAPVGDWVAIKKLAGGGQGTVQIGASLKKDEGLRIRGAVEVK